MWLDLAVRIEMQKQQQMMDVCGFTVIVLGHLAPQLNTKKIPLNSMYARDTYYSYRSQCIYVAV